MNPGGRDPSSKPRSRLSKLGSSLAKWVTQAIVDVVVAAVLGWLAIHAKHAIDRSSLAAVEEFCAVVAILVGVTLAGRLAVQVRIGYLRWAVDEARGWTRRKQRSLCALTAANLPLAAALIAYGVYFLSHRSLALQFGAASLLTALVGLSVNESMRLIEKGGPPRGSDVVWRCRPVRWLRESTEHWNRIPGVKALVRLWDDRLPRNHSSRLAIVMVFSMLLAVIGLAAAGGLRLGGFGNRPRVEVIDPPPTHDPSRAPSRRAPDEEREGKPAEDRDPCAGTAPPGEGVPEPLSEELDVAWKEVGPAVGCAGKAREIADGGVYAVSGHCTGSFRGMAVGSPVHPAVVVLGEAGQIAWSMGERGELLGASPRQDLHKGDFHFFYTADGPFVAIREQKTDGHGGPKDRAESCAELRPGGERYVVLPPDMAEVWLEFVELVAPVWPARSTTDADGTVRFEFQTAAGTTIASGFCFSDVDCVIEGASLNLQSKGAVDEMVTVERVLARMAS